MNKTHPKLTFEQRKAYRLLEEPMLDPEQKEDGLGFELGNDLHNILTTMQHSLTKIDVSEAEDEQVLTVEMQKWLEKALLMLQAKVEDLEVCSRLNTLRIVGLSNRRI
ncbi:hypothetical protein NDU88_003891 [Pleurodeles waltl]|uniref:Uncharacterized protein n=1 Tax=Pleurodeles waltl TaxID=8319 RepID=A0AAV7LGQ6_PLEWA|nr:hypothetical protein NDU88_003891 [Pleurodeles waltl]